MIQNIELRLLIISLELNALKAIHNNHTSPHCQEPDVSMIPRVGGEGIAARRKIVNGAMPLMDCAERVRISCAAPIERDTIIPENAQQNRADLAAAKRRQLHARVGRARSAEYALYLCVGVCRIGECSHP